MGHPLELIPEDIRFFSAWKLKMTAFYPVARNLLKLQQIQKIPWNPEDGEYRLMVLLLTWLEDNQVYINGTSTDNLVTWLLCYLRQLYDQLALHQLALPEPDYNQVGQKLKTILEEEK